MARSYTGSKRRMTDEQIVAAYLESRDTFKVAWDAGLCSQTVLVIVRKAGHGDKIARPGQATAGRYRSVPKDIGEAEIIRRYLAGDSGPKIAQAIGCTAGTVYGVLERNNIERRDCASTSKHLANAQALSRRLGKGARDGPS